MIPRPKSDSAARHNPSRWICTTKPGKCNGMFRAYGQDMPCPLRAKCYWGRRNTYEWALGYKVGGRCLDLDVDIEHRREHGTRAMVLQRLFAPKPRPPSTPEQREKKTRKAREKREKERQNCQTFGEMPQRVLLPCGEDCEGGCPYDGPCPYTDADIEAMEAEAKREKARRQSAEKYQRQKARMAVDPDYAEKFRAGNRRRNKAAYGRNPEKYRKWAREAKQKKRQQQKKG